MSGRFRSCGVLASFYAFSLSISSESAFRLTKLLP